MGRTSAEPTILRDDAKIGIISIGCISRREESLLRVVRTVGIAKSEIAKIDIRRVAKQSRRYQK